jgi:hypothetical protein
VAIDLPDPFVSDIEAAQRNFERLRLLTPTKFRDLTDVDWTSFANSEVPVYNSSTGKLEGQPRRFQDLTDVDWSTFADNDVATYNSGTGKLEGEAVSSKVTPYPATSISGSESRTNTAYGTLTTPDQVTSVVVPANGVLRVAYSAIVQQSVASAARIALFIGSNQLKSRVPTGAPTVQEASWSSTNDDEWAYTSANAGVWVPATGTGAATSVTTGMMKNDGPLSISVAAGTYTISVQFKASSGSVTAKERMLQVHVIDYS